ncbi:MAG: hypothetical protein IPP44_28660 [Ideonella sp.]|nr:hypothetical protein [Ideonella sp.]
MSLDISSRDFIRSMHNGTSCEDCHDSLDGKTHGKVKTALGSRRELSSRCSPAASPATRKGQQYDDGIHASQVKQGSDKARCARIATRRTPCAR